MLFLYNAASSFAITSLEHSYALLICTSVGETNASVTWLRDGVEVGEEFTQNQTLIDESLGTLEHVLSSEHVTDFLGTFTCVVMNTNNNTVSRTLLINGGCIIIDICVHECMTSQPPRRCDHH